MPLYNRLTRTIQGGITSTGNSLGITSPTASGNAYSMTALLSTNTSLQVAGYPRGTTTNYTQSSSNAYLNVPSGSTVVYAELMWLTYGENAPPPVQSITFSTPAQSNITISPIVADIIPFPAYGLNWAWNHADVTSLVNTAGAGFYTVGNVFIQSIANGISGPNWTLMVAYENKSFPYRFITINTGITFVSDTSPSTYNITNFITPSSGNPEGYLLMAYSFGDFADGASLYVGPSPSNYTQIGNTGSTAAAWNGLAPYNPRPNMFTSLICIADPENPDIGKLDTRGTFGTYNPVAYGTPGYRAYSRTLYDISGFDISNTLTVNQNTLSVNIRFSGAGGSANIQNESIQVDIQSANLSPLNKSVNQGYGTFGDTLIFTVTTANVGLLAANNVIFVDTTPSGTTFETGSVIVNNVSQPTFNPNPPSGISLGTIAPNAITTIIFRVKVNTTLPFTPNPVTNQSSLGYNFVPGPGIDPVITSTSSNITTTTITYAVLASTKYVSKSYANVGDILTYTIPITNTGNVSSRNIVFLDTIPNGTTFVSGSFKQDGVLVSGTPNIATTLPNSINSLGTTTVTFQVRVTTIPSPNPIPNSATANGSFLIDPSVATNRFGSTSTNSTTVNTQINNANLANSVKYVDKSYATCGDTINYTIVIPNNGNVTAQNVIFKDTLPNGTSLVAGTFEINGNIVAGANPNSGVTIPNIAPLSTTTITFSVKVNC